MTKVFRRFIGLLIIPCLLADSSWAPSLHASMPVHPTLITTQALAAPQMSNHLIFKLGILLVALGIAKVSRAPSSMSAPFIGKEAGMAGIYLFSFWELLSHLKQKILARSPLPPSEPSPQPKPTVFDLKVILGQTSTWRSAQGNVFVRRNLARHFETLDGARFFYKEGGKGPVTAIRLITFTLPGDETNYPLVFVYERTDGSIEGYALLWPDQRLLDSYMFDNPSPRAQSDAPWVRALPRGSAYLLEPEIWKPEGLRSARLEDTSDGFRLHVDWANSVQYHSPWMVSAGVAFLMASQQRPSLFNFPELFMMVGGFLGVLTGIFWILKIRRSHEREYLPHHQDRTPREAAIGATMVLTQNSIPQLLSFSKELIPYITFSLEYLVHAAAQEIVLHLTSGSIVSLPSLQMSLIVKLEQRGIPASIVYPFVSIFSERMISMGRIAEALHVIAEDVASHHAIDSAEVLGTLVEDVGLSPSQAYGLLQALMRMGYAVPDLDSILSHPRAAIAASA